MSDADTSDRETDHYREIMLLSVVPEEHVIPSPG